MRWHLRGRTAGLRTPIWLGAVACAVACRDVPTAARRSAVAETRAGDNALLGAPSIRDAASASTRYYGAAVTSAHLTASPLYGPAIGAEASIITAENELQWRSVERIPGGFDFRNPDALMQFAARYDLALRGHALLWPASMPAWVPTRLRRANADSILRRRIETAMTRYRGRIRSWDVVNEVVEPADGRADGLRKTIWIDSLGPDYIARAFRYAHAVDPAAQLVLNEYWLEIDSPVGAARRSAVLRLLKELRSDGVPVDALGIQYHTDPRNQFDESKFRAFLDDVARLGLSVVITEMDVYDFSLPGDLEWRDALVAAQYQRMLRAALSHSAVEGVITWGISDKYSWLDRAIKRPDGMPFRGLLLDSAFQRKPAWAAVAGEFSRSASRR